jgi:hypothetical protein
VIGKHTAPLHRGDSRPDYESLPASSWRSEKSVESPRSSASSIPSRPEILLPARDSDKPQTVQGGARLSTTLMGIPASADPKTACLQRPKQAAGAEG